MSIFKTNNERVILIMALSMFLPFYYTLPILVGLIIYTLWNKSLIQAIKTIPYSWSVFLFSGFSLLISLWNHNIYGACCSLGAFCVLLMGLYYQRYGNKQIFQALLKLFVFMSILCAIYGFYEYYRILQIKHIPGFPLLAFDKPWERINSVFFNANYYATMIEFTCILCVYLFLNEKQWKIKAYYVVVGLLNLLMLYLTACRTGWIALLIAIIVLVLLSGQKLYTYLMMAFSAFAGIVVYMKPTVIPRVELFSKYFLKRKKIWIAAWQEITAHPWIGQGPLTYNLIYPKYPGATKQIHAHSIYLDPLLSYGILGCALFIPYLWMHLKAWLKMKQNRSLAIAFTMIVLVHGILDLTIYFVPTAMFYLFILGSHFSYKQKKGR